MREDYCQIALTVGVSNLWLWRWSSLAPLKWLFLGLKTRNLNVHLMIIRFKLTTI